MKVLISDKLSRIGVDAFRNAEALDVDVNIGLTPEELKEIIGEYDALVIRSTTQVTADIIEAAKSLKVIGRAGISVNNVDLTAASKNGILVMNTPSGNAITTAEHTIAMLMALSRKIPQATASLKSGKWEKHNFMGSEVFNKTLGVIGMGRVGKLVVERAIGLKMNVIVYDPYISRAAAKELGVELLSLNGVLERADYITLHTQLIDEVRRVINKENIAKMKKGVYLVNCARGGLVNEADLAEALHSGHVAGAACDVFETEPIEEGNPLLSAPNFIGSPHIAASTFEAQKNVARDIALQVTDYLTTGTINYAVNFPSLAPEMTKQLAPFYRLAEAMGAALSQLINGKVTHITVKYSGEVTELNTKAITHAVAKGFLSVASNEEVNMVNSLLLASEQEIKVVESTSNQHREFSSLLSVEVSSENDSWTLEGTTFNEQEGRLVKIDDCFIEVKLSKYMVIFSSKDEPGVLGRLGELLGRHKINIAGMQAGRTTPRGKAVSVLNVDRKISDAEMHEIRHLENAIEARQVVLENV